MTARDTVAGLLRAVTVVRDEPKVGVGGILKIINTLSLYSFPVFLSVYMVDVIGFTLPQWQSIWGTTLAANLAANLLAGYASDWIGRLKVVGWGGGVGTALTVLALYYVPTAAGPNVGVAMAVGVLYGITLAMFVPLSAVVPLLVPQHKASVIAVLNLGVGLSNFAGPLIAGLVGPLGITAVVWILAGCYIVGALLTPLLREGTAVPATTAAPAPTSQSTI